MIFWFLFVLFCISAAMVFVLPVVFFVSDDDDKIGGAFCGFIPSVIATVVLTVPILIPWNNHADDLSKIRAQQPIIEVYEERRDTLTDVLENFNYPVRDGITLNADSPVASVVEQLSEVESKLADVKAEVAIARRSIEARRAGPMGGIVTLMGEE